MPPWYHSKWIENQRYYSFKLIEICGPIKNIKETLQYFFCFFVTNGVFHFRGVMCFFSKEKQRTTNRNQNWMKNSTMNFKKSARVWPHSKCLFYRRISFILVVVLYEILSLTFSCSGENMFSVYKSITTKHFIIKFTLANE